MLKNITYIVFAILVFCSVKIKAQCNQIETVTVCDMTIIDGDNNGDPDGIINLYDEYNTLTGGTISLANGDWFDPNYNFALDESTGDLYLWDLNSSSESISDYQFQLIDVNSGCPNGVVATVNLILGPFSGYARPVLNINDVNLEVCDVGSTPTDVCVKLPDVDLFETLESLPSPHLNGQWIYTGSSPNFISLLGSDFTVTIPYVQGPPLVDQETFELTYRISGIAPCNITMETTVNVSITRNVFSGYTTNKRICELDIINGAYDLDIDLTNNQYLLLEDIEGLWMSDVYGQITSPVDSNVNIKDIYQQITTNSPRFGCSEIEFKYFVEQRSGVCDDAESIVKFKIYEYLRPFNQSAPLLEFCEEDLTNPVTINLYDHLDFTTENGVLFDYKGVDYTNWSLVSGPSDLGLVTNGQSGYSSLGSINLLNAPPGNYVFRYAVSPQINCPNDSFEGFNASQSCSPLGNNTGFCNSETAEVSLTIYPNLYAGEDTLGLEFCETDTVIASPLDLFSLLTTNGVDSIYIGPLGTWRDASGSIITDPTTYTIPEINNQQLYDFSYNTRTANGCVDSANLSFLVYEAYQSGVGSTIDVCDNNTSFNLFDRLTGDPNTTGTWTGSNGYVTTDNNATFNPATSDAGVYIYMVPDNGLCLGNQASMTIIVHQSPNAGADMEASVCKSDSQIDLTNFLDSLADSGGDFIDSDITNMLSGNILSVSQLNTGTYNFEYQIQGHTSCNLATSIISITVEDVMSPSASNQTFCASDGATVSDLVASNGINYNWYDTADATMPLSFGTLLIDDEDYYVSAVDGNGCESSRVAMQVALLPLDHVDCDHCIKDGISVNGDNQNEEFDLCNLPIAFPDFELNIYNRYGGLVFKGNKNTELFKGISNTSLAIGKELPVGIYFYVFDPKDEKTPAFQGNFYLSR